MDPPDGVDEDEHAQCSTCALRLKDDPSLCAILGIKLDKPESSTCGLYVPGEPICDDVGELLEPDVAEFAETKVQCQRCEYGGKTCGFYEKLNKTMPKDFDLDTKIRPTACCNAWQPK